MKHADEALRLPRAFAGSSPRPPVVREILRAELTLIRFRHSALWVDRLHKHYDEGVTENTREPSVTGVVCRERYYWFAATGSLKQRQRQHRCQCQRRRRRQRQGHQRQGHQRQGHQRHRQCHRHQRRRHQSSVNLNAIVNANVNVEFFVDVNVDEVDSVPQFTSERKSGDVTVRQCCCQFPAQV